jgi:hypothetical protein
MDSEVNCRSLSVESVNNSHLFKPSLNQKKANPFFVCLIAIFCSSKETRLFSFILQKKTILFLFSIINLEAIPMLNVGVIGFGYWGPNIVRNFSSVEKARVTMVCDKRTEALKTVQRNYPAINLTSNADDVLLSPNIDVVAIVTPVSSHYELAKGHWKTENMFL